GKAFTAFIDMPSRPAAATHLAAAARKGEIRQFRCGLLTATGAAEHALAVRPVSTQGNAAHLVVAVTSADVAAGGRRGKPRAEPAGEVVQEMTRRQALVRPAQDPAGEHHLQR